MSETSPRHLIAAERRTEVLKLRREGYTYKEIGQRIGISSQMAHKVVRKELTRLWNLTDEEATSLRQLELDRLEELQTFVHPQAKEGSLKAVETLLKIAERRSRLLGLDAVTKVQVQNDLLPTDQELVARADRIGLGHLVSPELRASAEGRFLTGPVPPSPCSPTAQEPSRN
jgi:hypothetical protein